MDGGIKNRKKTLVLAVAIITLILGVYAVTVNMRSGINKLPLTAQENPMIKEAYMFAVEHPEVLESVPCYCGCKNSGHRHNRDCFVDDSGNYVEHGSLCGGCTEVALASKKLYEEGKSLKEIRETIDQTFGSSPMADPTPTPMPQ